MDNIILKVPLYAVHVGNELIKSPTQKTFLQAVEMMKSRGGCYLEADRQVNFLKTKTKTEVLDDAKIFVFGTKMSFAEARKRFAAHANVLRDIKLWEENGFTAVVYNSEVKTVVAFSDEMVAFSLEAQENIFKGRTSLNSGRIVWREPIFRPFADSDDIDTHIEFTLPHAVGDIRFNPSKYLGIGIYEKVFYENGMSCINKVLNHIIFQDKIIDKSMLVRIVEDKGMLRKIKQSKDNGFLVGSNQRIAEIPKPFVPLTLTTVYSWMK